MPSGGTDPRPARGDGRLPQDLTGLSLEELLQIEVVSVQRKAQSLVDAPAAVHVVRGDDIRRSGATSIPEALRGVPGLHVARIDANKWVVSSRGFSHQYSNKLLVLMDGRSVYTPLFAGVYWDVQDTLLEDVDRIEVVRGPGGVSWGANAVNGVINVLTRSAADTLGPLVYGGAGTEERGFGGGRYGFRLGDNAAMRVWARHSHRDGQRDGEGNHAPDGWHLARGGFRTDWDRLPEETITLQGDVYQGRTGWTAEVPSALPPFSRSFEARTAMEGASLLGRLRRGLGDGSEVTFQTWWDYYEREDRTLVRERRHTFDLEVQHRIPLSASNFLMWGAGFRHSTDRLTGSDLVSFDPARRHDNLFSAFLHDEIRFHDERLTARVGTRLEHNDYTGWELQPEARLLWRVHPRHAAWASVARAVRTPSRADHHASVDLFAAPGPMGVPVVGVFTGNEDFEAEKLLAFEAGWRVTPAPGVVLDLAGFLNRYDGLAALREGTPVFEPSPVPRTVVPLEMVNGRKGRTRGLEAWATARPLEWLRVAGGYTLLRVRLKDKEAGLFGAGQDEGASPRNQFLLRGGADLPGGLELDATAHYVDNLPAYGISSHVRLDARVGWRAHPDLDVSLSLQNLLDRRREEFGRDLYAVPTEVERGAYLKVTYRF